MAGNKHDNGVHEVGTPETLKAYQEDTPYQNVEKYLAGIQEVIQEKKNKQKKSFMQVFQNPLKGFPYNEELDDNFVKPLEESLEEARDAEFVELEFRNKNDAIKAYKHINNKLYPGGNQPFEDIVQEGKWLQFENVKDVKEVLKVFKKGGLNFKITGGNLKLGESLEEAKNLMPEIQKIVDTKGAAKVSGVMLDMFTASVIVKAYEKVNDSNKKKMEKASIRMLVNLAHKVMGMKEENLQEVTDKEINAVKKLSKDIEKIKKDYFKITKMGDKTLQSQAFNRQYESILKAQQDILKIIGDMTTLKLMQKEELEEGKMSDLLIDIQQGATAKELARDWKIPLSVAKDFLKDYYGQKKGSRKEEVELEEKQTYKSLIQGLEKDKKEISKKSKAFGQNDTKFVDKAIDFLKELEKEGIPAGQIGQVDFVTNRVPKFFVGPANKSPSLSKFTKNDVKKAVAHAKRIGIMEEVELEEGRAMKLGQIAKKYKREIEMLAKRGQSPEHGKHRVYQALYNLAWENGDIRNDDPDDTDEVIDDYMDDMMGEFFAHLNNSFVPEGESLQEGTWSVPDSKPKLAYLQKQFLSKKIKASEKNARTLLVNIYNVFGDDSLYDDVEKYFDNPDEKKDLRDVIVSHLSKWGVKVSGYKISHAPQDWVDSDEKVRRGAEKRFEEIEEMKVKRGRGNIKRPRGKAVKLESKMSGSKLTGQEISVYFRRNKVRDKTVRKAVEIALDHGGAMNYAVKQIEKLKRGLSKNKDVVKALNYANFGEQYRLKGATIQFKTEELGLQEDPYRPEKTGSGKLNKNIEKYWKKEIRGVSRDELLNIQTMYMITDHSGVVAMYKAGKRDFLKSIKN
ncbi:MAG: hypothetical protein CMK95_00470 [Pseudomonas sp.]|nr:hypothetical protein [Pseudomonas sp.]